MKKYLCIIFAVTLCFVVFFSGCTSTPDEPTPEPVHSLSIYKNATVKVFNDTSVILESECGYTITVPKDEDLFFNISVDDVVDISIDHAEEDDDAKTIKGTTFDIVISGNGTLEDPYEPFIPSNGNPNVCYKPVIYIYSDVSVDMSVLLNVNGGLTCTYPSYNGGWNVTVNPDGTISSGGKTYRYLYWEGNAYFTPDFSKGFCVKGSDTAAFLEKVLAAQGLTELEANDFITYWLPLMEGNAYNVISFQGSNYTDAASLEFSTAPDCLIRCFMCWYGSSEAIDIEPQSFETPVRSGLTVVEWGGTKI